MNPHLNGPDILALNLAPNEWAYLAAMLFELAFLGAGVAIVKARRHSVRGIFTGDQPTDTGAKTLATNVLLGIGMGGLLYLIGQGIASGMYELVLDVAGSAYYAEAQAGAVHVTPPSFSPLGSVLAISGQFFLVGLSEELFFRGVLFHELFPQRAKLGAVLSSLAFTFYHVFPGVVPLETIVVNAPFYFIIGLLFAHFAWGRRHNLIGNIVAHGTFNTIFFLLTYVFVS